MVYAGFIRRFSAFFIDLTLFLVLDFILFCIVPDSFLHLPEDISSLFFYAAAYALLFAVYCAVMESSKYQATIGKMFLNIKVADASGKKVSFDSSFIRAAGKTFCFVFPLLFFICILTGKRQNLYDILSRTFVFNSEQENPAKTDKSAKILAVVFIICLGLALSIILTLRKIGITYETLYTATAIERGKDPALLVWGEKRFDDIGITVRVPFILERNAKKENLLKSEQGSGISDITRYEYYGTIPFSFEIQHITFDSEVNLRDIMLKHGLRNVSLNALEDPQEFSIEETIISGREALKAVRSKILEPQNIKNKLLSSIVRANKIMGNPLFGKFEQTLVIRDTPEKVWVAYAFTEKENKYPFIEKMMDSLLIEDNRKGNNSGNVPLQPENGLPLPETAS